MQGNGIFRNSYKIDAVRVRVAQNGLTKCLTLCVHRYKKEIIQTNNLAKIEKIQGNNQSIIEKIQGNTSISHKVSDTLCCVILNACYHRDARISLDPQ